MLRIFATIFALGWKGLDGAKFALPPAAPARDADQEAARITVTRGKLSFVDTIRPPFGPGAAGCGLELNVRNTNIGRGGTWEQRRQCSYYEHWSWGVVWLARPGRHGG